MPINGLKRWHVYTLDYYSAIKKIISFAGIQRELKIILSKISQEDKYHMISLVCGGGVQKNSKVSFRWEEEKGQKENTRVETGRGGGCDQSSFILCVSRIVTVRGWPKVAHQERDPPPSLMTWVGFLRHTCWKERSKY